MLTDCHVVFLIDKEKAIYLPQKKWKALTDIVNFTLNLKLELCDEFTAKWIEAKARNIYFYWSLTCTLSYSFFSWQLRFFKDFYSHSIEFFYFFIEKTSRTLEMNGPKGKRFTKHWSKLKTYLSHQAFKFF